MKKILFICAAGMSTSLLVEKTKQAADAKGAKMEITALSEAEAKGVLQEYDVILLGPQVRYMKKDLEKLVADKQIPVAVIDSINYGRMDGAKVLEQILEML